MSDLKYDAFITYRRSDGAVHARALRDSLRRARLSPELEQEYAPRPLEIYLDTIYERADADFYTRTILPELKRSRRLIVVQTPDAARPRAEGENDWVAREIEDFCQLPQGESVSVALARGGPRDPLPANLHDRFPNIERVDVRRLGWGRRIPHDGVIKFLATLRGIPPERMPEVWQEETRRVRHETRVRLGVGLLLLLFFAVLASLAWTARNAERTERRRAVSLGAEAREQGYALGIQLADTRLSEGQRLSAMRILLDTPPEYRDWEWSYLASRAAPERYVFDSGHLGTNQVIYSPDGRRLATLLNDGRIWIWDVRTHAKVDSLGPDDVSRDAIAWRPGTNELALGDMRGGVIAFDLTSRRARLVEPRVEPPQLPAVANNSVTSLVFSSDGAMVSAARLDGVVTIRAARDARLLKRFAMGPSGARSVSFSNDDKQLAIGLDSGALVVWDLTRREWVFRVRAHTRSIQSIAQPRGSQTWLTGAKDGHLRWWDQHGNLIRDVAAFETDLETFALSHGSGWLAAISLTSQGILILDEHRGRGIRRLAGQALGGAGSIAIRGDDAEIATGAGVFDHTVSLWDPLSANPAELSGHDNNVNRVAWSVDGRYIATAGTDQTVGLWDTRNGCARRTLRWPEGGFALDAAFSRDSRVLAVAIDAYDRSFIQLWNVVTGDTCGALEAPGHQPQALAFSPDGKWLVSVASDVAIWDWRARRLVTHTMVDSTSHLLACAFSADSRRLTAVGYSWRGVWSVPEGRALHVQAGEAGQAFHAVAFVSGDSVYVTGGTDGMLRWWDSNSGAIVRATAIHETSVNGIAVHPRGTRLATAGADGTIRLIDERTGAERLVLRGHRGEVLGVAFNPSGDTLASVGYDNHLHLWRATAPPE